MTTASDQTTATEASQIDPDTAAAEELDADELIEEESAPIVVDDAGELSKLPDPSSADMALAGELLTEFLTGRPENTKAAYMTRLGSFAAFMGNPGDVRTAVATLLSLPRGAADGVARRWRMAMISEVKARRLAPGTLNSRLTVMRSLTTMAFDTGRRPFKIKFESIASGSYKDTRGMAKEDIVAMLNAPDLGEPMGRRDAAMLKLYFMCGLRVSEAINTDIKDFDPKARTLQVWGKKRQRYTSIPLPAPVVKALESHLAVDRFDAKSDAPLFVAFDPIKKDIYGTHRLTRQAVGARFKAYAAECGLDPADVHPHTARHSYVTQLLRAGVSLDKVAKGARHANVSTTMIYNDNLKNEMEDLADISGSLYGDETEEPAA